MQASPRQGLFEWQVKDFSSRKVTRISNLISAPSPMLEARKTDTQPPVLRPGISIRTNLRQSLFRMPGARLRACERMRIGPVARIESFRP